jgi:hypothetical protein
LGEYTKFEFGAVLERGNRCCAVKKKAGLFDKMYKWNGETYLNLVSTLEKI